MTSRSLGGRRDVDCKLTAAVYFSPIPCQISRYSAAKSSKTIPSLRPIFAQTPSAAQAPGPLPCPSHIFMRRMSDASASLRERGGRSIIRSGFIRERSGLVISIRSLKSSICSPAPVTVITWWMSALATSSRTANSGKSGRASRKAAPMCSFLGNSPLTKLTKPLNLAA